MAGCLVSGNYHVLLFVVANSPVLQKLQTTQTQTTYLQRRLIRNIQLLPVYSSTMCLHCNQNEFHNSFMRAATGVSVIYVAKTALEKDFVKQKDSW